MTRTLELKNEVGEVHIVPSDEFDLHSVEIPCCCDPTTIEEIKIHKEWGDLK